MAAFTPETIPDVADVREGFVGGLERHRVAILGGLALVVFGSLGLLGWASARKERLDGLHTKLHAITDDFKGNRSLYSDGLVANRDVAEDQAKRLEELRPEFAGTEAEPHLLLQLAIRRQVLAEDAKALALLDEIREKHPSSPVLRIPAYDSDRATLVERLASISKRRSEFTARHPVVEAKPDPSGYALVETDLGAMKIGFYRDLAPNHVAGFESIAKSGGFNGTRLYAARRGDWIELGGGDTTRNAEARDDRDDDPAHAMGPEDTARFPVRHRRRTVTSVPMLSGDQSDRFAIVLSEKRPEFDSVRTPFGELLDDDSASTADRLGSAIVYGEDAGYVSRKEKTDYPYTPSRPVVVRRVSIWKNGALAAGHTWDTARVGTDQVEPEPAVKKPADGDKKK
jgi:cyclophilin family peptidyl-prolyl cis-trans isomerase